MSVSLFGLFLVGILTLNPPVTGESLPWRKPVMGSIFGSICILGSLAALFPRKCSGTLHFKKEAPVNMYDFSQESDLTPYRGGFAVRGHHPDCGKFSAHVFRIGNRTLCTSCTGLLLGALVSLTATILYFFSGWQFGQEILPIVNVGILGVSFGLLQFPLFKDRRSHLRFLLNSFFVLGAFLILVGIDTLVQSVALDLFLIFLIVFWILTRISLTQWDHKRICYACGVTTCEFRR